jgi:hypothetical protein
MFRQKNDRGRTTQIVGGLTLPGIINVLYPVNSLLITTDNVNPGTRFTGTTWIAYAAGQALVGVGNNGEHTYTGGQAFGADSITLTAAQSGVNAHTHTSGASPGYTGTVSSDHTHNVVQLQKTLNAGSTSSDNAGGSVVQGATSGRFVAAQTSATPSTSGISANHQHAVGSVDGASGATAHENRQQSIAVYVWKRTA